MNDLVPTEFHLGQNYPNPFKGKTTIKYCIAYKTGVRITIYNSEGEMIDKLVDEVKEVGTYEVEFSVSDQIKDDKQVSLIRHPAFCIEHPETDVFYCLMKAGNYLSEKEMTIIS